MSAAASTRSASALAAAVVADMGMAGAGGFRLKSPAFDNGEELDPCFTAAEEDAVAPPLEWTAPPDGTAELALVVEAPGAGRGGAAVCHWLVWGLAPQAGKLLEGETPPRTGKNARGNSEWLLPDPPLDADPQSYVFQLFALDTPLGLRPGATRDDLLQAMDGHVLSFALLTATFAREADEDEEDWDEDGDD